MKKWWQKWWQFTEAAIAIAIAPSSRSSATMESANTAFQKADDSDQPITDGVIAVRSGQLAQLDHLACELLENQTRQINHHYHSYSVLQTLVHHLQNHQQTLNELLDAIEWLLLQPIEDNSKTQISSARGQNINLNTHTFETESEIDCRNLKTSIQIAIDEAMELTSITETLQYIHRQQCYSLTSQQQLLGIARNRLTVIQSPFLESLKLLLCESQKTIYAVPIDAIEQIVFAPNQVEIADQFIWQWQHRQEVIPIVVQTLSSLLADSDPARALPSSGSHIAILQTDTGWIGLQVDQVLGEQELVVHSLGDAIVPPPYVYGCCLTAQNHLALVIDVRALLKSALARTKNPRTSRCS
ncbi:chemotaxis protein CheW [Thermocoleostomius sinensis]|uniref:histidine kinase n=1 Tax=Thermocoleostomius sinensis A174 TaxID=2016057 RepID=A0A9E8ZJ29_9CYAN|nr:chemotaxis protein CheW [Thermocoleostomius sinensis]WAL62667.1 chemotaxis protein CheW [Thermocoleostomius sinensis A174]